MCNDCYCGADDQYDDGYQWEEEQNDRDEDEYEDKLPIKQII